MKLRNKKTGEIGRVVPHFYREDESDDTIKHIVVYGDRNGEDTEISKKYTTLAALLEEWEDYEEPVKSYWFVNDLNGNPMNCDLRQCNKTNFMEWCKQRKEIGNYFETKEEAELALHKLRAWKRLKDKGFKFTGWEDLNTLEPEESLLINRDVADGACMVGFRMENYEDCINDLDLLFGGEE